MNKLTRTLTYLRYKAKQIFFFPSRSEWQCVFTSECFDMSQVMC